MATRPGPTLALGAIGISIAAAGAAFAAAGAGSKITVCVNHKNGGLYRARRCALHDHKLSWNIQGPAGAQGIQGPRGDTGGAGPAGPGFQFTTTSGDAGPTLPTTGTYLVDVQASIDNSASSGPVTGLCSVGPGFYAGAFAEPAHDVGPAFSFAGLVTGTSPPDHLSLVCVDTSENPVSFHISKWWVSPIGS
jgi:hypothetical protein